MGSVQGSGVQVKVAGVSTAAVHDSGVLATEMVYPGSHSGAHDAADATLPPAPHIAEFATVGSAQASGEHDGGIPVHVPADSHRYPAPLPTAVYPTSHTTSTVQLDPTATLSGPHVASLTIVEFAMVSPGPVEPQAQTGAVPAHVPAVA